MGLKLNHPHNLVLAVGKYLPAVPPGGCWPHGINQAYLFLYQQQDFEEGDWFLAGPDVRPSS
jgi:hypothetical protein